LAILIFGLLIFVHELGHFLAARAFGVQVYEFAIGMGPAILKRQRGETLYAIRAIPFGGYCKMEGEDETIQSNRSLGVKPWWQRVIILFAGSFMNLVLGFIVCLIIAILMRTLSAETLYPVPPAEITGFFATISHAWQLTVSAAGLVIEAIRLLIIGGADITDVGGPIAIVGEIQQAAQLGIVPVLWLTAFISVNIGLFNLLPLPALDGGRIVFTLIEAIRRKPIPAEKEAIIHFVGIVLLLGLMVFVTFNDIVSCVSG